MADNSYLGDTQKEYIFNNAPDGIELVKVGDVCTKKLFSSELIVRVGGKSKSKELAECRNDFKIVVDNEGKVYKVKRGREFLNLMMKLQRQNKI